MRTRFSAARLADPRLREADGILRNCVHCGFCLPACPTYTLLRDERDSPRGRIYLIQHMLEQGGTPDRATVRHIDRCLSCLACTTACPSGVDYARLIDQARAHIHLHHRRPWTDSAMRWLMAFVLPRPAVFRAALLAAGFARPFAFAMPGLLRRLIQAAPRRLEPPSPVHAPQQFAAAGPRRKRVALLTGCVQQVMGGRINEATVRVLRRHGCEVVVARGAGCCGALPLHMGREAEARALARRTLAAWRRELDGPGLDAVVVNASGCGPAVRDAAHLFAGDPEWEPIARAVAGRAMDVTELMRDLGVRGTAPPATPAVAYHDACSLQHAQRLSAPARALLTGAGYDVREIGESHMCCGSAGTYHLLQPALADRLGRRKGTNAAATGAGVVAAGNLGCLLQVERFSGLPAVHTVELMDWATRGPIPAPLAR